MVKSEMYGVNHRHKLSVMMTVNQVSDFRDSDYMAPSLMVSMDYQVKRIAGPPTDAPATPELVGPVSSRGTAALLQFPSHKDKTVKFSLSQLISFPVLIELNLCAVNEHLLSSTGCQPQRGPVMARNYGPVFRTS